MTADVEAAESDIKALKQEKADAKKARDQVRESKEQAEKELKYREKQRNQLQPIINSIDKELKNSGQIKLVLPEVGALELASTYRNKKIKPLFAKVKHYIAGLAAKVIELSREAEKWRDKYQQLKKDYDDLEKDADKVADLCNQLCDDVDKLEVISDKYNRALRIFGRDTIESAIWHDIQREKALEEQKRKELEFSLLQAQIKPHFLYNALDAIYCLNEMGRCKEASSMTKLLSEYYRRALNNGLEKVTLKKEMELTEIYLQIQSVRYPSILSYRMECEKSIEAFEIPKLTLQPLVENAIYHGIKPLGRKGTVTVQAWLEQETVKIRVADNGAGLDAGLFEQCVSKERGSEKGYGLFNFAERLRLCYGDKCTITLEQADEGTSILIAVRGGLRAVNGKETL